LNTIPQTIAKNINGSNDFISDSYKTEQRGGWSLDININTSGTKDFSLTMEVCNDNNSWRPYLIIGEKVDRNCGGSWSDDHLNYDYIRFLVSSSTGVNFDIIFNERS
jgi:hypothetical protein